MLTRVTPYNRFSFPLDEMAAVCGFEAEINDQRVVGVVKEKEEAHAIYSDAIAAGKGAYKLDEGNNDG